MDVEKVGFICLLFFGCLVRTTSVFWIKTLRLNSPLNALSFRKNQNPESAVISVLVFCLDFKYMLVLYCHLFNYLKTLIPLNSQLGASSSRVDHLQLLKFTKSSWLLKQMFWFRKAFHRSLR